MPINLTTGERQEKITYEEFKRHTILLDKETYDPVEKFAELADGAVCLPGDDTYQDTLHVTPKFIHKGESDSGETRPKMAAYTAYTGSGLVSPESDLYKCILENYGEVIAAASIVSDIIHNPFTNCSYITLSTTRSCPFYGQDHNNQHPFIVLSEYGMRLK